MPRYFDPLLKLLVGCREQQLLAQIQFLKAENRILRSKLPKCVPVTVQERSRLLHFGNTLRWSVLKDVISIVSPWTFARWARAAKKYPRKYQRRGPKIGRPETPEHIREIIIRIARETGLGYTRIQGELKKLGIELSRSTITNILKGAGMSPDPHRGEGRWDEFLKMHAATLWACDFFCVRAWTHRGLKQFYAILFIHIGTRRIHVTPATMHPTQEWVAQQARNLSLVAEEQGLPVSHLLRDRDQKFQRPFDDILKANAVKPIVLVRHSPNLNAHAERAIKSIKHECLNHFILLGERHVNHLIHEYVEFYDTCRPHSSRGNLPPCRDGPPPPKIDISAYDGRSRTLQCDSRLGGLLKSYSWREAA